MTRDQFAAHLAGFFEELGRITDTKGREYSNDDSDQLASFKRIAARLGVSPLKVVLVYLTKHLDAIEHAARNDGGVLSESLHGRCLDGALYLILFDALAGDLAPAPAPMLEAEIEGPLPYPTVILRERR